MKKRRYRNAEFAVSRYKTQEKHREALAAAVASRPAGNPVALVQIITCSA